MSIRSLTWMSCGKKWALVRWIKLVTVVALLPKKKNRQQLQLAWRSSFGFFFWLKPFPVHRVDNVVILKGLIWCHTHQKITNVSIHIRPMRERTISTHMQTKPYNLVNTQNKTVNREHTVVCLRWRERATLFDRSWRRWISEKWTHTKVNEQRNNNKKKKKKNTKNRRYTRTKLYNYVCLIANSNFAHVY